MTNVQEAAARRRNNESPHYIMSGQSLVDADTLADAFLDIVPADDAEPLTTPWLESIGFKYDDERPYWWHNATGLKFDLQMWDDGDCWLMDSDNGINLIPPKTRGQLRLLCRALGIPLIESPATRQEPA